MPKDRVIVTKYLFIVFVALLVYLSYLMLKPFISAILLALLVAYILYPLNKILVKYVKYNTVSAAILTLLVLAIIVLPLVFVGNLMVSESMTLYDKVNVDEMGLFFSKIFNGKLDNYIEPLLQKGMNFLLVATSEFLFSLPKRIMALLIGLGVLYFSFKEGHVLVNKIKMVLPLRKEDKEKVIGKFKDTMDATIYGTIAMALIEGILASFIYWVFGLNTPILWGLVTAIVSMLPFVGPAAIWLPLSVYLFFTGHVPEAIGLAVTCVLVLTVLFDIFLRNKIIAKKGKIHPVAVLIGVIGGVSVFGISGFIIGPFLLSVLILFIGLLYDQNEIKSKRH